jgi:hypothetical protein
MVALPLRVIDRLPVEATDPNPSITTVVAFDTDQLRVVELPAVIELGDALK